MQNSKLSINDVIKVAKLAKLDLKPIEIEKFRSQLAEILDYFKILDKVTTDRVEPTSQVTGLSNVYHNDIDSPSLNAKAVLSGSKQIQNDMFKTNIVVIKI